MKYKGINIRKRNDNRYYARFTREKKIIYIYGKTQKECYDKLKIEYHKTPKTIAYNIKLFDWIEQWYTTYKEPELKESSLYQIRICIKKHIKENIENLPMNKLKAIDIDTALNKIQSSRMKKYTFDCYRDLLRQAYINDLTEHNLAERIKHITHQSKEGNDFNEEQINIILSNTPKLKYGYLFEFIIFTGVRKHGALNLKWEDIQENKILINETKTKSSKRYIPKFNAVNEILKKIPKTSEFVFDISESTIKRELSKLIELCGFHICIKDFRTTFATICSNNEIKDNVVAKWLGHSKVTTTKKYYIKVQDKFEQEQAQKIDTHFDTLLK